MHERDLFIEALAKPEPAERAAYLDDACGGDAGLRAKVDALLAAHERAAGFLDVPPPGLAATAVMTAVAEGPGTVIGPYKLLEKIGEGGFGVVFMAEQERPVRRKVALKVIKPGMDTREVVARFEAERQALALMDHPNIAKVFDGGATESGRPYFVMELVRGVPITDYCDAHAVPLRERLELFAAVCRAVQHAHTKGVIHRDLKPSNVLVTLHDGRPVVKVIDFGIAKATGGRLTDKTLFTGFAQLVGTPLYMSPEQAELSGLDVDTRSDIYGLGVLLYELLTGTTPFERERIGRAALDEVRRIIREEEPPKPSTRLSTLGERLTAVAAHRRTEPAKLGRLVRGDLDWVVMKALEKDRNRRYETANAFARDVERYLDDEPVEARSPSAAYRFRKFARRNKGPFAAAAVVLLALVAGAVAARYQAVRAEDARGLAESRLASERKARREADEARAAAITEAGKADAAADMLMRMFVTDPVDGLAPEEIDRRGDDLVARARRTRITDEVKLVELWSTLFLIQLAAGDTGGARDVAREAFELFRDTREPEVAYQLLDACVCVPGVFDDPEATDRLCELALRAEAYYAGKRLVGVVRYRQGRHREAIELIDDGNPYDDRELRDDLFLAMAYQGAGDPEAAYRHFVTGKLHAEELIDDYYPGAVFGGSAWWEPGEVSALLVEAEGVVFDGRGVARLALDDLVTPEGVRRFIDDPERARHWHEFVVGYLGYQHEPDFGRLVARQAYQVFRDTRNPAVAVQVLSTCVLLPGGVLDSPADTDRLCELALRWKGDAGGDAEEATVRRRREVAETAARSVVGAVRYREGRYSRAVDLLEREAVEHVLSAGAAGDERLSDALSRDDADATDRLPGDLRRRLVRALADLGPHRTWPTATAGVRDTLFLAMARHQAGDLETARGYLSVAKGWVRGYVAERYAPQTLAEEGWVAALDATGYAWDWKAAADEGWTDWYETEDLLEEAEELIGPLEAPRPSPVAE